MAFFHAVRRGNGFFVEKRGGEDAAHPRPFRRAEQVGQGELIVVLVIRVRVQHDVDDVCGRLLAEGSLSCTEIAYRCGFSGSSQFAMLFRRETGMSPTAFRAACRAEREKEQRTKKNGGCS